MEPSHEQRKETDPTDALRAALEAAQREVTTLRAALQRRTVIGEAIGITMIRNSLTEDAAVARLVELSQDTNVKVRDIAQRLVEEVEIQAAGLRDRRSVVTRACAPRR